MQAVFLSLYNSTQSGFIWLLSKLFILGEAGALVVISIVLGVVLVLIYGKISFQKKVAATKRDITANIMESVLYRHSLSIALTAQLKALGGALKYAGLAIPPLIILALPVLFVLGQLYPVFAVRALKSNEQAIVTAVLKKSASSSIDSLNLTATAGTEVLPPVRILSKNELTWRITAGADAPEKSGSLEFKSGESALLSLPLNAQQIWRGTGYESLSSAWLTGAPVLANPAGGDPRPADVFESIKVTYPENSIPWLGLHWNWLVLFFVVSLVAGLVAGKIAKIEI